MKKPLIISIVVIVLAVILFVVNPFAVFGATTAPAATESSLTTEGANTTTSETKTAEESHAEEDTGVIGLFGLNWKLFVAQLVNFAIVLFVLWKFVFKPVTNNMQARAKKIEDSLVNADRITKEKEEFEHWKAGQMVNARHEATVIINEAKQTAEKLKQDITESTKLEQQQIIDRTKLELDAAQKQTIAEAKSSIAELVIASTEKLLKAKIDPKTDNRLIKDSLAGITEEKI